MDVDRVDLSITHYSLLIIHYAGVLAENLTLSASKPRRGELCVAECKIKNSEPRRGDL